MYSYKKCKKMFVNKDIPVFSSKKDSYETRGYKKANVLIIV